MFTPVGEGREGEKGGMKDGWMDGRKGWMGGWEEGRKEGRIITLANSQYRSSNYFKAVYSLLFCEGRKDYL